MQCGDLHRNIAPAVQTIVPSHLTVECQLPVGSFHIPGKFCNLGLFARGNHRVEMKLYRIISTAGHGGKKGCDPGFHDGRFLFLLLKQAFITKNGRSFCITYDGIRLMIIDGFVLNLAVGSSDHRG